jgi:hypothetical protein
MTDGSFGGKRFGVFLYVKPGFHVVVKIESRSFSTASL